MASKGADYVMEEGNYGDKATGLFGWANNNPSSKSVIRESLAILITSQENWKLHFC
jgi:hypothetical protein